MIDLFSKLLGEGKNGVSILLFFAGALYIGKMKIDDLSIEIEELKQEQKEVTKMLVQHAATWSKIAERVKIYHKEK